MTKFCATTLLCVGLAFCCTGCNSEKSLTQPTKIEGYKDMKFGMSFDQARSLASPSLFNPVSLKGCLIERAVKGCDLFARDNTTTYTTVDGIPYGLDLTFNRYDKLTGIVLKFERSTIDDPDERLSNAECLQIHDRTIDWVARDIGLTRSTDFNDKDLKMTTRPSGAQYWGTNDGKTFILHSKGEFADNVSVSVLSTYLRIDDDRSCDVSIRLSKTVQNSDESQ